MSSTIVDSGMEGKKLKVKCTYPECNKHFPTEKDMKYHKKYDPAHNYCKRCDIDCLEWEDLMQHKVEKMQPWLDGKMKHSPDESPAHIVCEFCGEDFKSFGGRDKHRELYHQADQNIFCPGCDDLFVRASHLIVHFEEDRCREISCRTFRGNVTRRNVYKQIEGKLCDFIEGFEVNDRLTALPETSEPGYKDAAEDDEGGVSILDMVHSSQEDGHQPLVPHSLTSNERKTPPSTVGNVERDFPRLSIGATTSTTSSASDSARAWTTGATVSKMFPDAKRTATPLEHWSKAYDRRQDEALAEADARSMDVLRSRCWDPTSANYNVDRFFHSVIQQYCCPFPSCGAKFEGPYDLEEHLNSDHLVIKYWCPVCHKYFKRGSSLIAHAEAAGGRCKVKNTSDFNKLLDLVSGGFLTSESIRKEKVYKTIRTPLAKSEGENGVMTTKFTAQKPEDQAKTIVRW